MDDGRGMRDEVSAQLHPSGLLAVHEGIKPRDAGKWTVTLVSLGERLTTVGTEQDARRVADVLCRRVPKALGLGRRKVILTKLPKWVGVWCVMCRREGKYLNPEPYVSGEIGGEG